MPQIQIVGPSRQDLMMEQVGQSIGQGLGQFATNYLANKSLQNVLSDPALKDAPLSEKQSRLQQALQPYGEVGENILQKRMAIAQQETAEGMMNKAKKIASKPGATPSDILFGLIEAGQGVPGSERFIAPVFQQLMQQKQNQAILDSIPGGTGQPTTSQSSATPQPPISSPNISAQNLSPQQMQQPGQTSLPVIPQQAQQPQQQQPNQIFPPAEQGQGVQIGGTSGLYAGITPEEEINRKATAAQQATQDPAIYDLVYQREQARNAEKLAQNKQFVESQALETARQADILARNEQLEKFAKPKLPGASPEELNDFMRMGQKYSNLSPGEWYEKTRQDFDKFMNIKSQFDKAFVPGALRGIYLGGAEREKELSTLTPIVQDLKKYGKGAYARNRLAELGLTQTEIEKVYNPLPKTIIPEIMKMPKGVNPPETGLESYRKQSRNSPQVDLAYGGQVADLLMEHGKGNSLLALRDELMTKRHYSWEQFQRGLQMAEDRGFQLNPEQQAEREELRNPPRSSIANIFRGLGNILDVFRGAK